MISGPLEGWDFRVIIKLIDEAIEANKDNIDYYLRQKNVTLMTANEHVKPIVDAYLIPYLKKKKVQ